MRGMNLRALAILSMIVGAVVLGRPAVTAADEASDKEAAAKEQKALVRKGAREWSVYCGSCHNARPPGERSPTEWDTIMMHMRVRANLPARDAQALLAYLRSR